MPGTDFSENDYRDLLNLFFIASNSLKGTMPDDKRLLDCEDLAAKLFFHSATIYHLIQPTKFELPDLDQGIAFYDFASVAVLTRAVLDTYLTMFEVFFEPTTEDEREFRHARWLLAGYVIREGMKLNGPDATLTEANTLKLLAELRERLSKTAAYAALTPKQQRRLALGHEEPPRFWVDKAVAAGFGPVTAAKMRRFYSSYVHADGLSAAQIKDANTRDEQQWHMTFHRRNVMMILARAIMAYSAQFPTAKATCENTAPVAFVRAETYAELATRLP